MNFDNSFVQVPLEVSDHLSHVRGGLEEWRKRASELTFIEGPLYTFMDEETGARHAAVKVGASCLNSFLFEWSLSNKQWSLPADTLMLLMTYGGSNAPICHGGGLRHKSLSDLVLAIEYVDANGDLQVVDDPELLKAASGAFGLLGIVVSLTLRLDEMTYASYQPRVVKQPAEDYIPRPGNPLPQDLIYLFEVRLKGCVIDLKMINYGIFIT